MARGTLSENERHCLDTGTKSQSDRLQEPEKTLSDCKPSGLRVRFLDEEGKTERMVSADEVDCAVTRVKKIHILKNRSSSETSILLRNPSLMKRRSSSERRFSDGHADNLNNNSLNENLNGRIKTSEFDKSDKTDETDQTKEINGQSFKKNSNVYSVNQAKTLTPERRKSIPLAMPKLIAHKMHENGQMKSFLPAEVCLADGASGKDFTARAIGRLSRGIGKLLRRTNSVRISDPDPVYKVAYLGNVLTGWARGQNKRKPASKPKKKFKSQNKRKPANNPEKKCRINKTNKDINIKVNAVNLKKTDKDDSLSIESTHPSITTHDLNYPAHEPPSSTNISVISSNVTHISDSYASLSITNPENLPEKCGECSLPNLTITDISVISSNVTHISDSYASHSNTNPENLPEKCGECSLPNLTINTSYLDFILDNSATILNVTDPSSLPLFTSASMLNSPDCTTSTNSIDQAPPESLIALNNSNCISYPDPENSTSNNPNYISNTCPEDPKSERVRFPLVSNSISRLDPENTTPHNPTYSSTTSSEECLTEIFVSHPFSNGINHRDTENTVSENLTYLSKVISEDPKPDSLEAPSNVYNVLLDTAILEASTDNSNTADTQLQLKDANPSNIISSQRNYEILVPCSDNEFDRSDASNDKDFVPSFCSSSSDDENDILMENECLDVPYKVSSKLISIHSCSTPP